MAFCFQVPDPSILYYLQETAKCLPKPVYDEEHYSSSVGSSRMFESLPDYTFDCCSLSSTDSLRRITKTLQNCAPLPFVLPPTLHTYNAMDALNLISLQCTSLTKANEVQESHRPEASQTESSATETAGPNSKHLNEALKGPSEVTIDIKANTTNHLNVLACHKKIPRKQKKPVRSAERHDPTFEGVRLQMKLGLDNRHPGQYKLFTTSHYSLNHRRKTRKLKTRQLRPTRDVSRSSSSEEEGTTTYASRSKQCASCKTCKTPLWRDAEDGTPLCNACGIRYKKYGVRCFHCWNIPKKEGKTYLKCSNCGEGLRASISQRKTGKRKFNTYLKEHGGTGCC